jgi:two-component system NarL family response regulator
MICVLLVSEMGLVSNLIASVLEDEPDIDVVERTTSPEGALDQLSEADVVLVSTRLRENGALRFTEAAVERDASAKVLVIGLRESEQEVLKYVEAGADGYVLRDNSVDMLLEKVRAADQGEALISPDIAYALMSRLTELAQLFSRVKTGLDEPVDLTPREQEVLDLVGEGLTNQEIAERLYIEVGTVKNHVHSILQKLDVNSREDAAAYLALIE